MFKKVYIFYNQDTDEYPCASEWCGAVMEEDGRRWSRAAMRKRRLRRADKVERGKVIPEGDPGRSNFKSGRALWAGPDQWIL